MTAKPFGLEFLEPVEDVTVSPDQVFGGAGCTKQPGTTCVTVTIGGTGGSGDTSQRQDGA